MLGVPLGSETFVAATLNAKAAELGALCKRTLRLADREMAWRIFQSCLLASGKYHSATPACCHPTLSKRPLTAQRVTSSGYKPRADAPAEAKQLYEEKQRRYELLTLMLSLPYRSGGMAVRTPDRDKHAHYLAGRAEMMEHLRKYSVPCR